MNAISDYILTAFITSVIAGIGEKIAPPAMKKYITFIASIILLIFLISPFKSLGEELFRFTNESLQENQDETQPSDSYNSVLSLTQKKTEEAIQKHLDEKFKIGDNLSVSLTMKMEENGTILLTQISVYLSPDHIDLADEMKSYLEETFGTVTTIVLTEAL